MPVVVTGASGLIGREAVPALVRVSPEVRAVTQRREAAPLLRALGAKVAVSWADDVDNLAAIMAGAHTVCHLVGASNSEDESELRLANLASTEHALAAAKQAGVRRFLMTSYPGASPASPNPCLRFKGLAEEAVAASGIEHVILRCSPVYGALGPLDPPRWLPGELESLSGRGVRIAPISAADVAAVLAAADDRRALPSGVRTLLGPEDLDPAALVGLLEPARRGLRRDRAPEVRLGPPGPTLTATALEVMAVSGPRDRSDAADEFGIRPVPPMEGFPRTRVQAGPE